MFQVCFSIKIEFLKTYYIMYIKKKNKENRFIIVYHNEEEEGMKWAKLLILKGY